MSEGAALVFRRIPGVLRRLPTSSRAYAVLDALDRRRATRELPADAFEEAGTVPRRVRGQLHWVRPVEDPQQPDVARYVLERVVALVEATGVEHFVYRRARTVWSIAVP